jgi:glycosyltransferase involved in cell wall biosynthesis
MRVWTTVMGQRLDDAQNTRSMLLCEHLLRRGHQVTMWTNAWDHIRKEWRKEWLAASKGSMTRPDGLEIRFMKGCGYSENTSLMRLADHWLAARDFTRQARILPKPDAIVASCPDHITSAAAVAYGKRAGAATMIDIRDKWPDILFDLTRGSRLKQTLGRIGMTVESRRIAKALRDADGLVAMMDSMLDWGLAKAGRGKMPQDRVFFLTTAPKNFGVERAPCAPDHKVRKAIEATRGKTVFAFVGTFNRTQHPGILLDALELIDRSGRSLGDKAAFLIGGTGVGEEEIAARAAARPDTHYCGWLKPTEMDALLGASHVGLLLLNFPTEAFNNKTFSYLASGLPIISMATGDLSKLIAEHGTGVNVDGGDTAGLADAIVALANDRPRVDAMAAATRALFDARFDRESNYEAYAAHVEAMAAGKRTA